MLEYFRVSEEVITLGLSLFVLGFAIGPLLWAPMSEMYGRQILFASTFGVYAAFNAGAAGAKNIQTLLVLRFFAGAFGSSPLTNAGGVVADTFTVAERGLAMAVFAAAPFMGPVLGPIIGGFLGQNAGWRWVEGFLAAYSGLLWILGMLLVPETYAPVLLRRRAERLSKITGKIYRSRIDIHNGKTTIAHAYRTALSRPWVLLLREPIVFILCIYQAIIYGILFLLFGAFPIVYRQQRGWSEGISELAFLGIAVGMVIALIYVTTVDHYFYCKVLAKTNNDPPPEARLPPLAIGAVALPIGLFWFAWTNGTSIHWPVSITAGIPFGFGMVMLFLSMINYLVDAYTIFAASVLAATAVLRAIFAAVFPLFTTQMYNKLGIHWASSIPAFLALICVPFPFIFMRYGERIRLSCKYAAEADAHMRTMHTRGRVNSSAVPNMEENEDELWQEKKSSDGHLEQQLPELEDDESGYCP